MTSIRALFGNRPVFSVRPGMSVLDVARTMCEKQVGAIVVLAADGTGPLGIFSERDLMERVVARGADPSRIQVDQVMTRDVVTASPDTSRDECMQKMQERGCRHLPIVEGGRVIGMISLRDLLRVEIEEKSEEIRWMNAYIHDVPPDRQA
jgi:CBS domain-containing protein